MNMFAHVAAACILAVAACSPPAATTTAETQIATTTSETAPPAEGVPTANMLLGRWGDNGDCTKDITFNADGTFLSYSGMSGRWTLQGDSLTLAGQGGTFQLRVAVANNDTLMIGQPDGSFGISQRC